MMPAFSRQLIRRVSIGAVALVLVLALHAAAAPGDLDPTFDVDGKVTTDFGGGDGAFGIALQADRKIVAVGQADQDFGLARYNPNGSLDLSFDGDGKVTTNFLAGDEGRAVGIQGDGKIVVAGSTFLSAGNRHFAVARYNVDGSLDTSFSEDGKVITDFRSSDDVAYGLAIQTDGKVIVAGYAVTESLDFALARYNADGSLDTSFDGDGRATTRFPSGDARAAAVALQADGRIVAAGHTRLAAAGSDFAVARYNRDGSLDTTFDGDGKATTDFNSSVDIGDALAIQGDGKIAVGGTASLSDQLDFALARYNTDGSLDSTFDGDGKVTTDFRSGNDRAFGIALQRDGKIVAAGCAGGHCGDDSPNDFALARYKLDGSLDTIFGGGDGKVTTDFSSDTDRAHAVAIQSDGKILAAGIARPAASAGDFALARYKVCRTTSRRSSIPC
jgi:uncharacterized delta-60 repeat protein